jgi:hypothetical protein
VVVAAADIPVAVAIPITVSAAAVAPITEVQAQPIFRVRNPVTGR